MNVSGVSSPLGHRIIVIGSPGAGKSTLSAAISSITGIPLYHLDRLYWKPGWVPVGRNIFLEQLETVMSLPSWIIDGNYQSTLIKRFEASDTVIFMDFSRIACLAGAMKRLAVYRKRERPDLTTGCDEKFDSEFLKFLRFIWSYPSTGRRETTELLHSSKSAGKTVYVLHDRGDANRFIQALRGK
ncbi:MAG: hypothetical protein PXX82_05690 [Methanomassiliicoccales archaeon]|nr:hypothetical protein [Methanomassiliicoccales archaeon]